MKLRSVWLLATTCGAALVAAPVIAQTAPAAPAPQANAAPGQVSATPGTPSNAATPEQTTGDQLSDIVVTANKKARAEELQRVPIAETAFNQTQIQTTFARDITDIGYKAPGVRLEMVGTIPGTVNFSIRGMGINSSIASDEPTVGESVDGVYLASNIGGAVDNFDLDSIEILRGPQGTLFGRNVTGGAVVVTTRRPTGDFGLDVLSNVGSAGRQELSIALQDGITDDLAGRLSFSYKHLDGYFKNAAKPGHNVDEDDAYSFRPTLKWTPGSRTTITLIGQYTHDDGGGATVKLVPTTPAIGIQRPVTAGGKGYVPPSDGDVLDQNLATYTDTRLGNVTLEIKQDIGSGVLTSVTGYRQIHQYALLDQDASPYDLQRYIFNFHQHQWSEELRYAGTTLGGALDYTAGIYGFYQWFDSQSELYNPASVATSSIADGIIREKTAAGFAQLEYRFAENFSFIAGGRVTYDEKSASIGAGLKTTPTSIGACVVAVLPRFSCARTFNDSESKTDFSPKGEITWKPGPNTMLFGSVTQGFRSGGFNARNYNAAASPGPYLPEKVTAFEIGLKQDSFRHRLRTNFNVFYNKYTDLQETVLSTSGVSTVLNAANATIYGAEFEGALIPFHGFTLSGNVAYLHARYDSFNGLDLTGDGIPDPALAKNLRLIRAPKWTWSVTGDYQVFQNSAGGLDLNASYSYTGSTPLGVPNYAILAAYRLLDASIRYTLPSKRMSVSLYAKNLTNTFYGVTGFYQTAFGEALYVSPPRSYGLEAQFHF